MSATVGQVQGGGGDGGRRLRMAVVIVHYKTPRLLRECVETVLPELVSGRDEVVIIDNASGGAALEEIRALGELPGVRLIASEKNLGFAGANNLGIEDVRKRGGADYYMLLNPDTLVRPGAFGKMLAFLEAHPEAACVGPQLEFPDGTPQVSAFVDHTPISELLRGANIGVLSRLLRKWDVYGNPRRDVHQAQWLAGACVLMREGMLEGAGLLDDKFFMYFEEADFFRRARKRGYAAWYEPSAHVVHLVGQSSGVTNNVERKRLPAYWFESRHRYFRKHYGYAGMIVADGAWFVGHMLMCARRLVTGVSHSAVAAYETRDFVKHSLRQIGRPWRREAGAA